MSDKIIFISLSFNEDIISSKEYSFLFLFDVSILFIYLFNLFIEFKESFFPNKKCLCLFICEFINLS